MTAARKPVLLYFPALRAPHGVLEPSSIQVSEWRIGVPGAGVPWRSDRFRELATAFTASFGPRFGSGCLVWHVTRGFDGEPPSADDLAALQLVVTFCLLDANDSVDRADPNSGHYLATSENGLLVAQPIDVEQGFITHVGGGSLRKVYDGGYRIGEAPIPIAEGAVPIRRPALALLSQPLADALFLRLRDPRLRSRRGSAGLRLAMTWHASALQNSRSVTAEQRIIALKTGFEALLGTSKSFECGQRLGKLFRRSTARHAGLLPWQGILWSPNETRDIARRWKTHVLVKKRNGDCERRSKWTVQRRTDLEDWFMHFAEERNNIIHDGAIIGDLTYQSPRTTALRHLRRYDGDLFWIAERLLREAIKARLGSHILLAKRIEERKLCDTLANQVAAAFKAAPHAPVPLAPPAGRSVAELLSLLGASDVRDIEVQVSGAGWDVASGAVVDGEWQARSDAATLPLSQTEATDLIAEGAYLDD